MKRVGYILIGILLWGCGSNSMREAAYSENRVEGATVEEAAEYSPADYASSVAARPGKADSVRKFIRTAELQFKTKDVIKATYDIETIVTRNGGFVGDTELRSDVNRTKHTRVSRDSTLKTTFYIVSNRMELRVPVAELDKMLKEIAAWADFMDYRRVSATDVRFGMMRNDMARKRATEQGKRLSDAIDDKGEKLNHIADAEDRLSNKQAQADNAYIANLELKDRIEYSTVYVRLTQDETRKNELVADEENIDEYRPGFGARFIDALQRGWEMFVEVVLFLANLWVIPVILVIIWGARRAIKRNKHKDTSQQ